MMRRYRSKPNILTELNDRQLETKQVAARIKSKDQSFSDWIFIGTTNAPAFQNSWTNSDPTEVTYPKAGFIKNSSGWIQLCGVITGGASSTVAFTLPQSCRSRKRMAFVITNQSGTATGYVILDPTGLVTINNSGVASNWDLSSISFRAEN